ncbi:hypothetical protein HPB49_019959 [Dermacentor silvarum]|uniref:Uncharacterized protein n=1 Tax=Dermacentor silvarum TaxID=543639 RepID=A0ACB8DJX7_DERSI|nr:hypothetical protein HPB49_019959 [Dermacentor silvarum]
MRKRVCIAKELGLTPSTLNTIVARRNEIEENARNFAGGCKQARGSEHTQFDEAVFKWFKQARAAGVNFGGTILREKAVEIADKLGIESFCASNGWIDRFKKRHGICYRTVNGEAASVDMATVDTWKDTVTARADGTEKAVGGEAFADFDELCTAMQTVGDGIAYSDYISIDDAVVTSEVLSVDEIVAERADVCSSEDEVEEEGEREQLRDPTSSSAVTALDLLRKYVQNGPRGDEGSDLEPPTCDVEKLSLETPEHTPLSSSLEAEQRLLREMGWKEEASDDDAYAPLTEDELREFQYLTKMVGTGSILPACRRECSNRHA